MSLQAERISILGAGLVGSLLAIYLAKRGYQVDVFERRPDMRKNRISAGKSINLALSERGWTALERVGIRKEIEDVAIPMKGRMVHNTDGSLTFQPYGKEGQAIYSVSRGGLNCTLMDCAEKFPNIKLHFNQKVEEVNLKEKTFTIEQGNGKVSKVNYEILFGADGAFSALRAALQRTDRFEYSQSYIEHGYKELTIPANDDGSFKMEKNALHIWPRKNFMLIALPNLDGSFTCTLFFQFDGEESFSAIKTREQAKYFFEKYFPDAIDKIPNYLDEFFSNPTSSLVTVRCYPWSYEDSACLIGDAAHAIVPFFGQGMNCGFEDCRILDELMEQHQDWASLFKAYQQSRKPNADAIATLALNNFIEMRDLVADPHFLYKKKIESRIAQLFPEQFISAYGMVSFTNIPYAEALQRGQQQNTVLEQITQVSEVNDDIIKQYAINMLQ
jgi:kynurenine 3-monooxygenase